VWVGFVYRGDRFIDLAAVASARLSRS
jgi:hypothetical protein